MKQGTGNSRKGDAKVEPKAMGINPKHVAQMGLQQINTRPVPHKTRGFHAPMAGSMTHPKGTQGRH